MTEHIQQVELFPLSAEWEKLIFPPFKINPEDICIAFAAYENGTAVGLIASFAYPLINEAFVASFFVTTAHRNKGIGSQLMTKLLEHLKGMGIKLLQMIYSDAYETMPFLEKILRKTGWASTPKVILRRFFLDKYSFHPDWFFSPYPVLPQDFSLFTWKDASKEDIELAKAWEKGNPLIALYSPFNTKYPISEFNSLGLRWNGVLAGWMIVLRQDPKHLLYSGLFITPELRGLGPSICLLKEAIRRHINQEIETVGVVEINRDVSPPYWYRFIEKRLAPYSCKIESVFSTYKID